MVVLCNTNDHSYSDVDLNSYVETYFSSLHFIKGPSSIRHTLMVPPQFGVLYRSLINLAYFTGPFSIWHTLKVPRQFGIL